MKNNKGITLIALIITIIVMLILVAVTVAVVVNSNLIGTAQGAKTNTEAAYAEESNISGFNVTIGGEEKYFNNAEEYVNYLNGNSGAGPEGGNPEGGDDTTGEEDNIVVIDSDGEYILHVFGQKFQIGQITWGALDEATDLITVISTAEEKKVNGKELYCSVSRITGRRRLGRY